MVDTNKIITNSGTMAPRAITRYAINGAQVPSPNDASFQDIVISRSWDDIDGKFQDHLIRNRKQIQWTYKALNKNLLIDFYHNVIMKHIVESGERTFSITTDFPGYASPLTTTCYLGTPIEFKPVLSQNSTGVYLWSFTLIWTETVGIDLRKRV